MNLEGARRAAPGPAEEPTAPFPPPDPAASTLPGDPRRESAGFRDLLLVPPHRWGRESGFPAPSQPRTLPDHMEGGRNHELVVERDPHVAGLVEGGGHGARGVAQEAAPEQKQYFGCWREQGE